MTGLREDLMKLLDRYYSIYDGERIRAIEGAEAIIEVLRERRDEALEALGAVRLRQENLAVGAGSNVPVIECDVYAFAPGAPGGAETP